MIATNDRNYRDKDGLIILELCCGCTSSFSRQRERRRGTVTDVANSARRNHIPSLLR